MEEYSKINYIYTIETMCKGCNKCIFKCPTNANRAFWENSKNILTIKSGYCISCGECISVCDHGARNYLDDIDIFFEDLKSNKDISLIIAPAAYLNFEKVSKVIGFLKSKGVKKVYDVSYGADICTWGYLKYIRENNPKTVIAQPCPVVVSYIEKFRSDLISYLSPVHSPAMCLAVYLKKYENTKDSLAFLSPCIGKKRECTDKNTNTMLNYNITFSKLLDYITANNINLDGYPDGDFDNVKTSIGFAFPRPGGLTENVKYHLGDEVWTKQIEGIFNIEHYFKELTEDIANDRPVPLIIDALNCEQGCNLGTGTKKNTRLNSIDYSIDSRKKDTKEIDTQKLTKAFNETLKLSDFLREYTDRSFDYQEIDDIDLDPIFRSLGKFTIEDKNTNCFSCGYGSCYDFARAVARGDNHINNCHHFLLEKFTSLSTIDSLTNVFNRYSYSQTISELKKAPQNLTCIIFADINKLKETNDVLGHDAGDALIISSANILKKLFNGNIYRVGGDEFIIIEDSHSREFFINKIETLKELLKSESTILLSIGFAFCEKNDNLTDKINEAERNMYIDKENFYKFNTHYDRRKV